MREISVRERNCLVKAVQQQVANLSATKRALLASRLKQASPGGQKPSIPRRAASSAVPLSFGQQRLWLASQMDPSSSFLHVQRAFRLTGALDQPALVRGLDEIVRRHEALRTVVRTRDGLAVGEILPPAPIAVPVLDLESSTDRDTEARNFAVLEGRQPFDMSSGPLLRAKLLRLADQEHILLVTMHHCVTDGWSTGVLVRELAALYNAFSQGRPSPLPALPIQYADYASWQRQGVQGDFLDKQLTYWKQQLRGDLPVLELPTDRPRPAVQTHRGARQMLLLPSYLAAALRALSHQEGVTLFMTLLAALKVLLHRYSGQDDILVGTPVSGRSHVETEGLLGFFVNTLVVRTELSDNPTFRELLQRVRETMLGAFAHQELPYEKLVEALQPNRDLSRAPLCQATFQLRNFALQGTTAGGLRIDPFEYDLGIVEGDLDVSVCEQDAGLLVACNYSTDLFDGATIGRILRHLQMVLEGAVSDPEQRIRALSMLTEAERQQLLVEWNDTRQEYPTGGTKVSKALPTAAAVPDQRHLPFPLTDVQQAYWIGRTGTFELGNVATHAYLELESADLDLERFNGAWQGLIDRHDMLRAVVLPDGQQQILEQVPPYQTEVLDLRGQDPQVVAAQLEAVRQRMSHQVLRADQWPLFEVRASRLGERQVRLHISMDGLIRDNWSWQILVRELAQLYQDPQTCLAPLDFSFRDYVLAEVALRDSAQYHRALDYWMTRLPTLPPAPELPLAVNPSSLTHPRFVRRSTRLDPETWQRLKSRATKAGLTPSCLLLAAYAEVLTLWSKSPRFTINLTLFNRLPLHPRVNEIVGDFTSLTLLAVDNSAPDSFEVRARDLQEQLWKDLDHRYVSGVQVMRELAKRQGGTPRAAMPVVFTSTLALRALGKESPVPSFLGEPIYSISQTPQVWLDYKIHEEAGGLTSNWDAVEALFPEGFLDDLFGAYCRLLRRLADDEANWREIHPLQIPLAQQEQRTAINATQAPVPAGMLHTLFAEQASQRPLQPAVIAPDRTLTYAELDRLSNRVGHRLRQLGAGPNRLVGVVTEKGWEQVVAVLGVLRSGAAYLPIEAGLAKERLWHLLEHGGVQLVLTQPGLDQILEWPEGIQRLCVDTAEGQGSEETPLDTAQGPEDLAYVIYTSGSTGLPKGVMIDHRGAVNTILDINHRFGVGPTDRVLALSSLSFDLSVYDIFGALAAGGTIIVPKPSGTKDPAYWADLLAREKITLWNSVPALMELLVEYVSGRAGTLPRSLRLVLLSGDWIPLTLPEQIKALSEVVQVISLGGATEASIWSILYPITAVDSAWKSIPYGKPMVNQRFHVLNEALEPCPVWVLGQLHIGGIGLAQGYWRDAERTRASFVTHVRTGERLYRTGDLGRYLPDGNIEFLGREDLQVKIQGYRVELGEIEHALARHPAVRSAVVTAVGERGGNKRLAAYVVAEPKQVPPSRDLRHWLEQKLPAYMVPAAFVILDQLPLSANGKVNRLALPNPASVSGEILEATRPGLTDLTARMTQFVRSILKVDPIEPSTNLLYLGATSVDMIRIANLLDKELHFRPKMDEFYRLPTVAGLVHSFEQQQLSGQEPTNGTAQALPSLPKGMLASAKQLLDPAERDEFKKRQPGLRRAEGTKASVQLVVPLLDAARKQKYAQRRSQRQFLLKPIPLPSFSEWLSCLSQIALDGVPKYQYGSAGGLYPVQTYLHIKPGRIQGLSAGTYYYHPVDHGLMQLSVQSDLDRSIHDRFINRPAFEEAAFSLFLIAPLSAIAPIYGERSLHYATIEAGLMTQLLEMTAAACQIGLCQIGHLDFQEIRHFFALEESHTIVHSLIGGLVDPESSSSIPVATTAEQAEPDPATRLLQRIKKLSKEDVRTLLEANKRPGGNGESP